MFGTFAIGLVAGWFASMPVTGPISGLVFARGIEGRYKAGTYIGIGGGLVEALYAFLAFLGFGAALARYPIVEPISRAAGAVVLLVIGVALLRPPAHRTVVLERAAPESAWGNLALGAGICGMNPTLLVTWGGFIATVHGIGLVDLHDPGLGVPFAVGCAVGTTAWFAVLMATIRRHRRRFRQETMRKLLRVMGVMLMGLSAWFAWSFGRYVVA